MANHPPKKPGSALRHDQPHGPQRGGQQGHAGLQASDPAELAPGTLIDGRYRVVRVIGVGGTGIVYEVEHNLTGQRLALKTLLDQAQAPRLEQEARALARLRSRHVVKVVELGQCEAGPFMVMTLLVGRNLRDVLESKVRLPLSFVANLGVQVCEGLDEAHRAGLVHRDLKPDNMHLADPIDADTETTGPTSGDGKAPHDLTFVTVFDFGVVKMSAGELNNPLTRTGSTVGTPYYMSLEQLRGAGTVDAQSDVYALCVVLYECLAGQRPFEAGTLGDLIFAICSINPAHLSTVRSDLPREVCDAVMRGLSRDKKDRPQTMRELARVFAPYAAPSYAGWLRAEPGASPQPPPAQGLGGALPVQPSSRTVPMPPTEVRIDQAAPATGSNASPIPAGPPSPLPPASSPAPAAADAGPGALPGLAPPRPGNSGAPPRPLPAPRPTARLAPRADARKPGTPNPPTTDGERKVASSTNSATTADRGGMQEATGITQATPLDEESSTTGGDRETPTEMYMPKIHGELGDDGSMPTGEIEQVETKPPPAPKSVDANVPTMSLPADLVLPKMSSEDKTAILDIAALQKNPPNPAPQYAGGSLPSGAMSPLGGPPPSSNLVPTTALPQIGQGAAISGPAPAQAGFQMTSRIPFPPSSQSGIRGPSASAPALSPMQDAGSSSAVGPLSNLSLGPKPRWEEVLTEYRDKTNQFVLKLLARFRRASQEQQIVVVMIGTASLAVIIVLVIWAIWLA